MNIHDDVKTYKLIYARGTNVGFFVDLCEPCCAKRLILGASILEKRRPVTASACVDCDPEGTLRK